MNVRLEILHLRMIKTIAELGSVTRSAQTLGITQSALSHRIKEAERRLGQDLFERRNKSLILNQTGKRLLYSAELILTELENVEHQIRQDAVKEKESIRIAVKADGCFHSLPKVIKNISTSNSELTLEIVADTMEDPLHALNSKMIDLAITLAPPKGKNYRSEKLFSDEMMAVLPLEHPSTSKKYLEVQDFSDSTYITHNLVPQHGKEYELFFSRDAARPQKVMQVGLTEAIIELVEAGFGVTILTRWVLDSYLDKHNIVAIPLTKNGLFAEWYGVMLRDPGSPTVRRIINEIKASCKNLV